MLINSDANIPLPMMSLIFGILFIIGILATLPLYGWGFKKLFASKLFTKIIYWIPIYIIFSLSLHLSIFGQIILCAFIAVFAAKDVLDNFHKHKKLIILYYLIFVFFVLHFPLFETLNTERYVSVLIAIAFGSVLADVFAYFLGNYIGKHKLPKQLNNQKSWEGVIGELIGAFVGVLIVNSFILESGNIYLFIPIGFGSIAGDLANSYVKREINIKDWSNRIPGHGGYLDRFSSLSFAIAFSLYWLIIFDGF